MILVVVVAVAAWMFRSAVKDVFGIARSVWGLLKTLVRLITPGRVNSAYAVRGTSAASQVSATQDNKFMRLIGKADISLDNALDLLRTHSDLSFQEDCSMALLPELLNVRRAQGDKTAAHESYDAAVAMRPDYLRVHAVMLSVLSERWLGKAGEGLALAQRLGGPNGPLPELVPIAHIEQWMDLHNTKGYFQSKGVGDQIEAAFERILDKKYADSWSARHGRVLALNAFAFCFCKAEQKRQAQKVFAELGSGFTTFPWNYLGDSPEKVYLNFRDQYT